jgi:hypothetical protein
MTPPPNRRINKSSTRIRPLSRRDWARQTRPDTCLRTTTAGLGFNSVPGDHRNTVAASCNSQAAWTSTKDFAEYIMSLTPLFCREERRCRLADRSKRSDNLGRFHKKLATIDTFFMESGHKLKQQVKKFRFDDDAMCRVDIGRHNYNG